MTAETPKQHDSEPDQRVRVASKVFDNIDFGFQKITVERLFQATPERIACVETERAFMNLADSSKNKEAARLEVIEAEVMALESEILALFREVTA